MKNYLFEVSKDLDKVLRSEIDNQIYQILLGFISTPFELPDELFADGLVFWATISADPKIVEKTKEIEFLEDFEEIQ